MIEASLLAIVIDCLCMVENPENDTEAGILQIQPVMVEELNRIAGREKWKLSDRRSIAKSKCMAMEYLIENGERWMTPFALAMLWKKGPTGMIEKNWSEADEDYAQRVANLVEDARRNPRPPVVARNP